MRSKAQWLDEYARTHQNPVNKRIHYVCVPLIFWSVLGFLWWLPTPWEKTALMNWALLSTAIALLFYLRLGFSAFAKMILIAAVAIAISAGLESLGAPLGFIAVVIFVLAWIGQFYGHKVEGKKPSFFDDLAFLLIGPLWTIEHLTQRDQKT